MKSDDKTSHDPLGQVSSNTIQSMISEIKSQFQLFLKLSTNLCPLLKAINSIAEIRNSFSHNGEMLSNEIFGEYWDILKKSIIDIQDAIGSIQWKKCGR
jgi:hypothetical protein